MAVRLMSYMEFVRSILMQLQDRTNNVYYLSPAEIDNPCRIVLFFYKLLEI